MQCVTGLRTFIEGMTIRNTPSFYFHNFALLKILEMKLLLCRPKTKSCEISNKTKPPVICQLKIQLVALKVVHTIVRLTIQHLTLKNLNNTKNISSKDASNFGLLTYVFKLSFLYKGLKVKSCILPNGNILHWYVQKFFYFFNI